MKKVMALFLILNLGGARAAPIKIMAKTKKSFTKSWKKSNSVANLLENITLPKRRKRALYTLVNKHGFKKRLLPKIQIVENGYIIDRKPKPIRIKLSPEKVIINGKSITISSSMTADELYEKIYSTLGSKTHTFNPIIDSAYAGLDNVDKYVWYALIATIAVGGSLLLFNWFSRDSKKTYNFGQGQEPTRTPESPSTLSTDSLNTSTEIPTVQPHSPASTEDLSTQKQINPREQSTLSAPKITPSPSEISTEKRPLSDQKKVALLKSYRKTCKAIPQKNRFCAENSKRKTRKMPVKGECERVKRALEAKDFSVTTRSIKTYEHDNTQELHFNIEKGKLPGNCCNPYFLLTAKVSGSPVMSFEETKAMYCGHDELFKTAGISAHKLLETLKIRKKWLNSTAQTTLKQTANKDEVEARWIQSTNDQLSLCIETFSHHLKNNTSKIRRKPTGNHVIRKNHTADLNNIYEIKLRYPSSTGEMILPAPPRVSISQPNSAQLIRTELLHRALGWSRNRKDFHLCDTSIDRGPSTHATDLMLVTNPAFIKSTQLEEISEQKGKK